MYERLGYQLMVGVWKVLESPVVGASLEEVGHLWGMTVRLSSCILPGLLPELINFDSLCFPDQEALLLTAQTQLTMNCTAIKPWALIYK